MWWESLKSLARSRHRSNDALSQAQEVQNGRRENSGSRSVDASIRIVGIGTEPPDYDLLDGLAADLARTFKVACHVEDEWLNAQFTFDTQRDQYYATALLQRLSELGRWPGSRILGVCSVDLFVPVLTFVFGEAQIEGHCAVVSYYRLPEPDRPELLRVRLVKEAIHELGHTFGLRHCHDWNCVMSSSHAVERLDIKSAAFCPGCKQAVLPYP